MDGPGWGTLLEPAAPETPRRHVSALATDVCWSLTGFGVSRLKNPAECFHVEFFRASRLFNSAGATSGRNPAVLAAPLALSEARPNSWDPSVSRLTSVLAKWISSEEQSIQSISGGGGGVEEWGGGSNDK